MVGRSGLFLERYEPLGVHDDRRLPGPMGEIAAPGVLDAVANLDANGPLRILQPPDQGEASSRRALA